MVLSIDCPGCGKAVSALATACPACGFPVILYSSMVGRAEARGGNPLELVAMNPNTPPVILEMLCGSDSAFVRAALARNPKAPEGLLLRLADDSAVYVREALASSPFATTKVIERLSDDTDEDVLAALYQNPSTPEYVLVELEERVGGGSGAWAADDGDGSRDGEADCYDDDDEADGYDGDDDAYERPSRVFRDDDSGELYYEYGDRSLPYHDGGVEYDGKFYDVMDIEGAETMYFDEDNGWLTDLPCWGGTEVKRVAFDSDFSDAGITNLAYWCTGMNQMTEVLGFEDCSGATNVAQMFNSCGRLETIWATSFDNSAISSYASVLYGCSRLVGGSLYVPTSTAGKAAPSLGSADGPQYGPARLGVGAHVPHGRARCHGELHRGRDA